VRKRDAIRLEQGKEQKDIHPATNGFSPSKECPFRANRCSKPQSSPYMPLLFSSFFLSFASIRPPLPRHGLTGTPPATAPDPGLGRKSQETSDQSDASYGSGADPAKRSALIRGDPCSTRLRMEYNRTGLSPQRKRSGGRRSLSGTWPLSGE